MSTNDVKKESREQRARIKQARREAIDMVQQLGTDCLAARRRLGITVDPPPEPAGQLRAIYDKTVVWGGHTTHLDAVTKARREVTGR